MRKLGAIVFLATVAAIPVVIVTLFPEGGGVFVAGYVVGVITVPMVAIGAIRAVYLMTESTGLDGLVGVVVYGFLVIVISLGTALWAFFR